VRIEWACVLIALSRPASLPPCSDDDNRDTDGGDHLAGWLRNGCQPYLYSALGTTPDGSPVYDFFAPVWDSPSGSTFGPFQGSGRVKGVAKAGGFRPGGQNLNFTVPVADVIRFLKGPCNSRELWRGTGILEEELAAYSALQTAAAESNANRYVRLLFQA
jgi:hypothetical protein